MVPSRRIALIVVLLLLCTALASIKQTFGAIYEAPTGIVNLQLVNVDGASKLFQFHVVFEEYTSPIFDKRSTSVIVWKETGYTFSAIIRGNDPEWQLLGTNDENVSSWRLEKDLYFQFNENWIYPFQEFKGNFYIASNMSHLFYITPMLNYLASVNSSRINAAQFPQRVDGGSSFQDFSAQGIYDFNEIEVLVSVSDAARNTALIIWVVFFVFLAIFALLLVSLFWRKGQLSFTNSVTITTGVLFFLPILLLTFRTSVAPSYLTLLDIMLFMLILLYGVLLCIQVAVKVRRKKIAYDRSVDY